MNLRGLTVSAVFVVMAGAAMAETPVERGQYLAHIMDCGGCHNIGAMTPTPNFETPLGGGTIGFQIPGMGTFYPPNLTPDAATGLGTWSDDEIIAAITTGLRPDGRQLAPAMPWMSYGHINADDVTALVAYLRSLKPVSNQVPGPFGPEAKPTGPFFSVMMPQQGS